MLYGASKPPASTHESRQCRFKTYSQLNESVKLRPLRVLCKYFEKHFLPYEIHSFSQRDGISISDVLFATWLLPCSGPFLSTVAVQRFPVCMTATLHPQTGWGERGS